MRWRLALLLGFSSGLLALLLRVPGAHVEVSGLEAGLVLQPSLLSVEGCNALPQTHAFQLVNNTGVAGTFDLDYLVPGGDATLTGPSQISLADGQAADFTVVLTPDLCVTPGSQVYARIEASGNGFAGSAEITQVVQTEPRWELAREHPLPCLNWLVESAIDPRDGQEYIYVAGCNTRSTYRYDPRHDVWTTLPAMLPDYLWDAGDGAAYQGRIYARSDGQGTYTGRLYAYDVGSDTWSSTAVPAGVQDRARYEAVELGGHIYFLGGQDLDSGVVSDAVDRYDPATATWANVAPMRHARALAMAWVRLGKIYVAGGLDADGPLSSTEVYDPATDTWTDNPALFAPLPAPRYGAGDAVLDGQLWLTGGFDSTHSDDTLVWLAADNAWHAGPSLPAAASQVESTALAGHLYAVGGTQDQDNWLDYNQHLVVCPDRSECQGWLEGQVYDAELPESIPSCTATSLTVTPGGYVPVAPATGHYGPLPLLPGAYLLEAGAPGYSLELTGVTVDHGMTTTQNIGLWRPRVAAGPERIQVRSDPGADFTSSLLISNTGHLALEVQLFELAPEASRLPGDELPWLSLSPTAGEIAPSHSLTVELTFECTAGQDGQVLTGTLRLLHNDPCAAPLEVSLEFACGEKSYYVYLPLVLLRGDLCLSAAGDVSRRRGSRPEAAPGPTRP